MGERITIIKSKKLIHFLVGRKLPRGFSLTQVQLSNWTGLRGGDDSAWLWAAENDPHSRWPPEQEGDHKWKQGTKLGEINVTQGESRGRNQVSQANLARKNDPAAIKQGTGWI